MSNSSSTSSSRLSQVKRLAAKILIGAIVFSILSFGIQYVIDNGLRQTEYKLYAEWNDIYEGRVADDLVILGSSRATVHISPQILEDELGSSAYNLGIDGHRWRMQYCRFRILVEHNPIPKQVVVSLDSLSLENRADLYLYEQFLPYLEDPLMRECAQGYEGSPSSADLMLPLYKYYGLSRPAFIGFLEFFNLSHVGNSKYKGYDPQDRSWNLDFDAFKSGQSEPLRIMPESASINDLESLLSYARDNGIAVTLVYSPEYFEIDALFVNRAEILALYRKTAERYGASMLDYSKHELSYNRDLFYNSQHLNKEGSEIFSQILAKDLKRLF